MVRNKKILNLDSVVRIDSSLLGEVEEFINLKENSFKYVNRKQFIDIAVSEYLLKMKKRLKDDKH